MAALILYIGISQNVNCDNMVGFPKSGHNCHSSYSLNKNTPGVKKERPRTKKALLKKM